jgi:hypothetical protein
MLPDGLQQVAHAHLTARVWTVVNACPDGLLKWRASGQFMMPVWTESVLRGQNAFFLLSSSKILSYFYMVFHLKTVIS